ncbi:polysaccharide pyruvyl transferase family protein [Pontiella agarivorans]|uniref:Polysaccharide pyruvyl transferase family protein n=1 Tax=Pontiella agarivorans TaxID=3038953 RepID=A0ABU5MSZ6_9BACT|nr:polysaccharide pyruvyl transferase family protein [Pontiella agarivorans]MDZ8117324.1 polysaccharide pyruvyl transferase family protein [Pontiella agarivorans]
MSHIVIINQPINNRGDQAAHKSFVELLRQRGHRITVLFFGHAKYYAHFYQGVEGVEYLCIPSRFGQLRIQKKIEKKTALNAVFNLVSPMMRQGARILHDADFVVCAPGGVCMGAYQSWRHVNLMLLALRVNPFVSIWGRSIGPFPAQTKCQKRFAKISLSILRRVDFISLRDKKSQGISTELDVSFTPTIDTAFATVPEVGLPVELKYLKDKQYWVFVPNKLYAWHPDFKDIEPERMDQLYISIMDYIDRLGMKIVMLPQLFHCGDKGDVHYFYQLAERVSLKNEIEVIDEVYDSDVQQAIIRNADGLVGARYHSIVFAINNLTPFVCLSYEHKMHETLGLLNLKGSSVELREALNSEESMRSIFDLMNSIHADQGGCKAQLSKKRDEAQQIVKNAYEQFEMYIQSEVSGDKH